MNRDTKDIILDAAKDVFTRKGFAGARMQEIADVAGINKGLLHYYFKSKKKLFTEVFNTIFDSMSPKINDIFLAKDLNVKEKISLFIDRYMDVLLSNPFLVAPIICELNAEPAQFVKNILKRPTRPEPMLFIAQFQEEMEQGLIRPIDPFQFFFSVISMCVFPFIGRPVLELIMHIETDDFLELMEERKRWIKDFVVSSLEPNKKNL